MTRATARSTRKTAVSAVAGIVLTLAAGSGLVAPAHAATARLACTTTLTGSVPGTQTVAAGEKLCLRTATVGGAITVEPGGALDARSSRVEGAITSSAAQSLRFCGSETATGAISVSGTTGTVRIGDNRKCAGNTVDGEITIASNTRAVKLARTSVNGAVTLSSNASRRGAAPLVSANRIEGDLSCAGNKPAPTDRGRINRVDGQATGQCTDGF